MFKRIVLANRPKGDATEENFSVETFESPELNDGQVSVRVSHFSLDPYMRGRMDDVRSYAPPVQIGRPMEAGAIGVIEESRFPGLIQGQLVYGRLGWTQLCVIDGQQVQVVPESIQPNSLALGVLGMPGFTGWWGFLQYGLPREGETIVIGAVTGPVGSMVAQLAKLRGLRVIGIAGSDQKCDLALNQFGVDHCLNHRSYSDSRELEKAIKEYAPDGIDIYFENVGGKLLEAIVPCMREHGRIVVCGMISWYNSGGLGAGAQTESLNVPKLWRTILVHKLSVKGFIISDHWSHYEEFVADVAPLVAMNVIKYLEDVVEGIDRAPNAFIGLLRGDNLGKLLVKV